MNQTNGLRSLVCSVVIVSGALAGSHQAMAWGHRGHQTLAIIGSKLVPNGGGFWAANADSMGMLTNVPDQYWKQGSSAAGEKPNHWFQPDSYTENPDQFSQFPRLYKDALSQYSAKTLSDNGTAPWRIKQFYDLSVAAFKRGDDVTGLQMAGAMSHYIGDLSQPLHVTKNYDGQETGDVGIHKFFETDNLEKTDANALTSDVTDQAKSLLADDGFQSHFNARLVDSLFDEIDRAYALKDLVINTDLKQGRSGSGSDALLKIATSRLADGAATLAIILSQLSKDAGIQNHNVTVSVPVPKWVAPDFNDVKQVTSTSVAALNEFLEADDCDQ